MTALPVGLYGGRREKKRDWEHVWKISRFVVFSFLMLF